MAVRHVVVPCFLLLAPMLACADGRSPTGSAGFPPAFDFINNPDNGNDRIQRVQVRTWWAFVDEEAGLFLLQSAGDGQLGCVTPTYRTWFDVQQVVREAGGADWVHTVGVAHEAYLIVYRGPYIPDESCADRAARKIAQGKGLWHWTNNDYHPQERDHTNANAYGVISEGLLDRVGGGTVRLNALQHCVWDGSDPATERCVEKISLH